MTIQELFNEVIADKDYRLEVETNNCCTCYDKNGHNVFSSEFGEFVNFLNCLKELKEKENIVIENLHLAEYLFSMLVSIAVYDGINLKTILQDEYIQRIDIEGRVKLFFAKYVKDVVVNVRFAGEDGEGCSYNTCDFKKVKGLDLPNL